MCLNLQIKSLIRILNETLSIYDYLRNIKEISFTSFSHFLSCFAFKFSAAAAAYHFPCHFHCHCRWAELTLIWNFSCSLWQQQQLLLQQQEQRQQGLLFSQLSLLLVKLPLQFDSFMSINGISLMSRCHAPFSQAQSTLRRPRSLRHSFQFLKVSIAKRSGASATLE